MYNVHALLTGLLLKSGLCEWCLHREWTSLPENDDLREAGWHWCLVRNDMIHNSMGCLKRRDEMESVFTKRIPLRVRLGLDPNEQGEYLMGL